MKKRTLFLALLMGIGGTAPMQNAHAQNPEIPASQAAQVAGQAVPGTPASGEKVELKLCLQAGKSYLQKMRSEQKISQTIDKERVDVTQTMGMNMLYAVKSVDEEGVAEQEIAFQSVLFKTLVKVGKKEMRVEYDSAKPPREIPLAARGMAALVGQKFTVKMAPNGRTVEIRGIKEMQDKMLASLQLPPGRERAMFEETLKAQFGEAAIKEMLEKSTGGYFPDKPVAVGESWSHNMTMTAGFPLAVGATYTLLDRQEGMAHLSMKGSLSLDNSAKPMQAAESKVSMKLNGSQSGTVDVRESDGWMMKMQSAMRFSGTMTVATAPASPGDLKPPSTKSWPIYMAGTVSVETEDVP